MVFRLHWAFQAAFDAVCTLLPLLRWRGGGNGLTVGTSVFRLPLHPIQSSLKPAQAFHHRRPFNQPAVGIGEPAEAVLHAGKRCARLHHVAESERFGEVHRQRGDDGDENADAHIRRPKGFLAEFAVGEPAPVVENAAVALLQAALFGIRALIKRYLLGMVRARATGRRGSRLRGAGGRC